MVIWLILNILFIQIILYICLFNLKYYCGLIFYDVCLLFLHKISTDKGFFLVLVLVGLVRFKMKRSE